MGGGCPPGDSEEVADLHGVGGGVVLLEDRAGDLVGGLALQDALDSQLGCPLVVTLQGVGTAADHVAVPQDQIHLGQDGVHVGGDLPALVDLHGVGEGVGHGVGVVDLFSIEPRWGAGVPPLCHWSDCHKLSSGCLVVASKLPSLAASPDRLAPLAALRLGAMHQQGEGCRLEAMAVVVINNQPSSVSICFCHEHFTIASEHTFVDEVVELATIAGGHVEVLRQSETNKQWQVLAVAVELQIRIVESNHKPRLKIGGIEEVSRLVNTDEFSIFFASFLEFIVDKISTIANPESFNNCFEVSLSVSVDCIILHLAASSEATELGVLAINNRTLAVGAADRHGEALKSTGAGAACWQAEDEGALVQLSVALGEVKHRSGVVDLFSIGGRVCPLVVLVDSVPTGTGSELYSPVWVIVDTNPEEVLPIGRTKEETITLRLFYQTLWLVVHQVSKSVLCFLRFGCHKCKVVHGVCFVFVLVKTDELVLYNVFPIVETFSNSIRNKLARVRVSIKIHLKCNNPAFGFDHCVCC